MTKRCNQCGEQYDDFPRDNHQCTRSVTDTLLDIGVAVAVDSMLESLTNDRQDRLLPFNEEPPEFRGFDGGDFGGGGYSGDF